MKSILSGPESTIKGLSWYVIIQLCQITYEALQTQILLVKYCDYLSMSIIYMELEKQILF